MAVTSEVVSVRVVALMNGGTSESGSVITRSVAMPGTNATAYVGGLNAARSAYKGIVDAYEAVSSLPLYAVREVQTTDLKDAS